MHVTRYLQINLKREKSEGLPDSQKGALRFSRDGLKLFVDAHLPRRACIANAVNALVFRQPRSARVRDLLAFRAVDGFVLLQNFHGCCFYLLEQFTGSKN